MAERKKQSAGATPNPGPKSKRKMTAKQRRESAAAARKRRSEAAAAKREQAALQADPAAAIVAWEAKGAAKTVENAEMYKSLMRDWARGYDLAGLAEKYLITTARVSQIVESLKGTHLTRLGVGDPMFGVKFAQDLIARHAAAVSEYTKLADDAPESQIGVKLGALKRRDEALDRFTNLVQELGWLPRHLGTLNVQMDALAMAEVLVEKLTEHGIADAIVDDIVGAIELRVSRQGGQLALAPAGVVDVVDAEEVRDGSAAA